MSARVGAAQCFKHSRERGMCVCVCEMLCSFSVLSIAGSVGCKKVLVCVQEAVPFSVYNITGSVGCMEVLVCVCKKLCSFSVLNITESVECKQVLVCVREAVLIQCCSGRRLHKD